ncbi:MAG: DUF4962 domain-containing protein [Acidobacteriota bacterium]|nr:DUF4962 domain-containing protein [Acidobacteriota bacterium]
MKIPVIVTTFIKYFFFSKRLLCLLIALHLTVPFIYAQTPSQKPLVTDSITSFSDLLKRPVNLRPELKNVHPKLFFTAADLPPMRERAKGVDRELWQAVLEDIATLKRNAPDPKDEDLYKSGLDQRKKGSISQYEFAFQIAQTSFAYAVEDDEKYLEAAKKWTLVACEMPLWGYTYNKPNVDLPPAHLLYAVAFAYDVLFDKLSKSEREIIKDKLVKQSRLMYDYFKYKDKKRYTYSQNHTWIPMAGLAIAAYALMDETEEAKDWAQLSRAVFDRMMLTFGTDGYFYESFHYYGFAFRWTIRYFDAHLQATGENLYLPMKPKFERMKYFVMHSILPDRENVFDFADIGDGSLNRNKESKRESVYGEYDILYRFARVYQDAEAQTIADFIRRETTFGTREPMWAFINHNAKLKSAPLAQIPLQVYFDDNDTVFWRSSWDKNATAFAFRAAPPEGHHAARLAAKISDWRQNTGHAHPDANSFIIWANGKYLTGDTGYAGRKETGDHNTILINNRGQEKDGRHEVFKEVPNERLDKIRIAEVWGTPDYFYARGEAASGYYTDLNVKKFDRHFLYVAPDYFVVWDELETEEPSEFSFLLNADREIKLNGNVANLINEDAVLRVVKVLPNETKSEVTPQIILARGLPGSVEKGVEEQRGVQLITQTTNKTTSNEFLHFLQVSSTSDKTPAPQITATDSGLKVIWTNGDEDLLALRGTAENQANARSVVRLNKAKNWTRLIWQNTNRVTIDGQTFAQTSKPLSASFTFSSDKLSGSASASENTEIKIKFPRRPKNFRVNGQTSRFNFDEAAKTLTFTLQAGKNLIEGE